MAAASMRASALGRSRATPAGLAAGASSSSRAVARAAPGGGARRVAAGAAVGPNELMQLAAPTPVQVNEIFTAAGTMFGVTLFGLAIGFVLLRVEAAVESK